MATAKQLASGRWRALVYDYTDANNRRHYKSFTADTKKEANYLAAEYSLNKKEKRNIKNRTFGEALDEYIENRSAVLSPRTIMDYKRIRQHSAQELMDVKVADITQELIQTSVNREAKTHSPKTVRNTHGLISAVMKCERPDFALNTALPKKERPNLYIPSDKDIKALISATGGTEMELPILLAAFGPMRRGEICALDSGHIKGNVVHVERNMVRTEDYKWIIKQPKSYAGDRYIPYPDFVAEKWAGRQGRIVELTPDAVTLRFRRILKREGVPHFRFHDLRHYCASIQHAIGIPDSYIMQRGGWGNDGVLKNVYRHALEEKEQEMNDKANQYFAELCNTKCNTKIKKP